MKNIIGILKKDLVKLEHPEVMKWCVKLLGNLQGNPDFYHSINWNQCVEDIAINIANRCKSYGYLDKLEIVLNRMGVYDDSSSGDT